jgi:hypothetical protein
MILYSLHAIDGGADNAESVDSIVVLWNRYSCFMAKKTCVSAKIL